LFAGIIYFIELYKLFSAPIFLIFVHNSRTIMVMEKCRGMQLDFFQCRAEQFYAERDANNNFQMLQRVSARSRSEEKTRAAEKANANARVKSVLRDRFLNCTK